MPPQMMPLWHNSYFELKATEEKFSAIPLSAEKQGMHFPLRKTTP